MIFNFFWWISVSIAPNHTVGFVVLLKPIALINRDVD